ncbi:BlaI/MecI/CopY family transcriptional regulator [Streptomyces sp. NPDC093248]|uniref:BlaI/MecI/CopY family transcriptional regulator n=1 Tax=Streptomyces sp. NPDC093248 TaxID=3155072 RepID=UPI00343575FC
MPEATASATALTSQYVSQVASDLEHNVKEQERINAELGALREQLISLQHDHGVLVSMQKALGIPTPVVAPSDLGSAAVPSPRKKTTGVSGARRTAKAAAVKSPKGKKQASAKPVAVKPAARNATRPTLVDLIHRHLAEQSEPRSAAEVTKVLSDAHADRSISPNVVRTTLESLVAKGLAQRNKQGSSVFYTASPSTEPVSAPNVETRSDSGE